MPTARCCTPDVERLPALAHSPVQAQRSGSREHQTEEDEAIEHRGFAHIQGGIEALRGMGGEIGHRHLARTDEGGRSSEEASSEEHTSELQSIRRNSYAVFCLKKQNTRHQRTSYNIITKDNEQLVISLHLV